MGGPGIVRRFRSFLVFWQLCIIDRVKSFKAIYPSIIEFDLIAISFINCKFSKKMRDSGNGSGSGNGNGSAINSSMTEDGSLSLLSTFWGAMVDDYIPKTRVRLQDPTSWTFEFYCLPVSIAVGVLVGCEVPGNHELSRGYRPVSSCLGWLYFFTWSIAFYPQIYQNWTRGTSIGMASDKVLYDILGFVCLSTFNVSLYFIPSVRGMYQDRYDGSSVSVRLNDVCFSLHALVVTLLLAAQMAYFDGMRQRPSTFALMAVGFWIVLLTVYLVITLVKDERDGPLSLLSWLYFTSFVKIGVTLIKYVPQVLLNAKRKSTVGWNITACIMDLVGGVASALQLILDCNDLGDWTGVPGNIVKVSLGVVCSIFDIIFIFQHFGLYHVSHHYHNLPPADPLLAAMRLGEESGKDEHTSNATEDSAVNTSISPMRQGVASPPLYMRTNTSYSIS